MEQQEVIFRLSMMEQQMNQMQQQLQAIERGINDLQSLNLGLDEIPSSPGKEILAPIGKGIYVRAKVLSEELLVNVGDNNFVNRSVKEAKDLIGGQVKKLGDMKSDIERSIEMTNEEFMGLIQKYQGKEE